MTGTISAPAPFSIVSGGSFSLLPGQPQQVVVKFSSATAGSFSQNLTITSNAGTKLMPVSGVAHKVSFSPATVNFGEGMFVVTEQCGGETGECLPYTKRVGLPLQGKLVVKNEGGVAVSLNLGTSAPFYLPGGRSLTLSAGQSAEVAVRFDPTDSGTFTGAVQVTLQNGQGSLTSGSLTGVAHKIELSPAKLDFGIVIVENTKEQKLMVQNRGATTLVLMLDTAEPFVASENRVTLAPSENHEITVRVIPLSSGELNSSVNLKNGQGVLLYTVPVSGYVFTFEEFLQLLSQLSQQVGVLNVRIPGPLVDVGLLGFQDVTESQIQALIDLAQNEDWSGFAAPDRQDVLGFLIRWVIGRILGMLLEGSEESVDMVVITDRLFHLAEALASSNPDDNFNSLYDLYMNNPDFSRFVLALADIMDKLATEGQLPTFSIFGSADALGAVRNIIRIVAQLFFKYEKVTVEIVLGHFGGMAVLALAALDIIDNAVGTNLSHYAFESLYTIATTQSRTTLSPGSFLWDNLARALAYVFMYALVPTNQDIERQFSETMLALVLTGNIAGKGWTIVAFRVTGQTGNYQGLKIDMIGVGNTAINNQDARVALFAQFFHIVRTSSGALGYSREAIEGLAQLLASLGSSTTELGIMSALREFFGPGTTAGTGFITEANKFGGIVVVDPNHFNEAVAIFENILGRVNYCGGRCFGIVVKADPDTGIVEDIVGVGISRDDAIRIAAQFGIEINKKVPVLTEEELEMLKLWLMAMFMR